MDLIIPKEDAEFFKQIWKILGIVEIPKNDLIYKICYEFNLPFDQKSVKKKIGNALSQGILLESNNHLRLNESDLKDISIEQAKIKDSIKKNSLSSWNRIEESFDPWMNSAEKKNKISDSKSLNYNAIIKKIVSMETLLKGRDIAASQFQYSINDDVITGDVKETNYSFKLDFSNKTITHNCQEFIDSIPDKGFCEHFYRIFMYLKKKHQVLAEKIVFSLFKEKKEWNFTQS